MTSPSPRRHLAFGTLLATGAQIAPLFANAALSLTIARRLGPAGTGSISLVLNLFDAVLLIFTFGLSSGITYFVSRGEWPLAHASRAITRSAAGLGIVGALCGLGFYILTRHSVLKGITPVLAIVSLASLPFAISWAFSAAVALGRDRYETYASLQLTNAAVILLVGVLLTVAFGLVGAVAGFAAANVITAFLGWAWARRRSRQSSPPPDHVTPRDQLRRAGRFGLQAWTAGLLQLINYRLDIFVLAAVASRSAVGVYSVAVSVTALGWVLPDAFQTVLFPRIASLDAAAVDGAAAARASDSAAASAVRHSVLILIPTVVVLAILVLLVPLLYGAQFHQSTALGSDPDPRGGGARVGEGDQCCPDGPRISALRAL